MNKFKLTTVGVLTFSALLAGCNHTGINPSEPEAVSTAFQSVHVYSSRADLPQNSKILRKITAQNKDSNGFKMPPEAIIEELKRQAVVAGGNGIVLVTPGTSQTTANAVLSY